MSETVLYEVRDRVAWLTLNRPEQLNAQNDAMTNRLVELFTEISRDDEVLAAVITGAGDRAFSAGADLKEVASGGFDVMDRVGRDFYPYVSKPLIAAIQGYCLAGGFELALRCDIRIATPDAQFGLPEPRWSLMAGYGLHNLSRMVPLGEALYMQLSGERIGAQRAYEIGVVQKVVPREGLLAEAARIANAIAQNAPLAVQGIKKVVMTAKDLPVEHSWKYANLIEQRVYASEDFSEGPKAFAEKRKPRWKGR
jgi:enoyl-CoA hydratase/carnithine racemase